MIEQSPTLPCFYEGVLESNRDYSHPDQDVRVEVELTGPSGTLKTTEAFWDGGRIWRFRFSPPNPGLWSYRVKTSDESGEKWLGGKGDFVAEPYAGPNPLYRHGPLAVSPDGTHLIHADGRPFFWLADTAWNGVMKAEQEDWERYLDLRKEQGFTVIQSVMTNWRAFPADARGKRAYRGQEDITVNPSFFRALDSRVEAICAHGLVPCLVMLWALTPHDPGYHLPVEDAVHLARYIRARYRAFRPVWFLGGDGRYGDIDRWRRIGRSVFPDRERNLVTLHPCGRNWIGEDFRNEEWYDFIGYQSSHGPERKTLEWIVDGPPAQKWENKPQLPVINLEPCYEEHRVGGSDGRFTARQVRRAVYYSLFSSPAAGITYGHGSIWPWCEQRESPLDHRGAGVSRPWHQALNTEGIQSLQSLRHLLNSREWWKLRPADELVVERHGGDRKWPAAAAATEDSSFALIYLPEGGSATVAIPQSDLKSNSSWFDPRTGECSRADCEPVDSGLTFTAPDSEDWVLVLTA